MTSVAAHSFPQGLEEVLREAQAYGVLYLWRYHPACVPRVISGNSCLPSPIFGPREGAVSIQLLNRDVTARDKINCIALNEIVRFAVTRAEGCSKLNVLVAITPLIPGGH